MASESSNAQLTVGRLSFYHRIFTRLLLVSLLLLVMTPALLTALRWSGLAGAPEPPWLGTAHFPEFEQVWPLIARDAALAVVLAVAIVWALTRWLVRPLERIAKTAEALGTGDLQARTGVVRRDEIGQVAAVFDTMAERLQQTIDSERELLGNVSHELRTPLARIRVALELAEESPERARTLMGDIAIDLSDLEQIVTDVLTFARLDPGKLAASGLRPLRVERVKVNDVFERIRERFGKDPQAFELHIAPLQVPAFLRADPVLLRRVLDNLVDNARKYAVSDKPVEVSAALDGRELVVQVADRGPGIPEVDLEQLFTPFFRADSKMARPVGGIGLGLSLARRIVLAHRGTLTVRSQLGIGTVFELRLPVAELDGDSDLPAATTIL